MAVPQYFAAYLHSGVIAVTNRDFGRTFLRRVDDLAQAKTAVGCIPPNQLSASDLIITPLR